MPRVIKVDHIAIATGATDAIAEALRTVLGIATTSRELVASQKTEASLLPVGETSLELIEPQGNEGLQKFVEKRGTALHHIALEVEDLDGMLRDLEARGVPLIDTSPRVGARGHRVAFIHPKATGGILFELVEPAHST